MTQHILLINSYIHDSLSYLTNFFKSIAESIYSSRMNQAMSHIRKELMKHRAYRETYNELSKLSDAELYDIGLNRGMIHSIALEATLDDLNK